MTHELSKIKYLLFFVAIMLVCKSCYKDGTQEPNPFEENIIHQDSVDFVLIDVDPTSIAGLYQNIFGPNCANSGCHDGTFEPDFRTIESSYHSMVYKTPIKNDGSLTYRVDPGNPDQSAIMNRLHGNIIPRMPIEIEPDSDWLDNSETYIQNVKDWIQNGARDLSGNKPQFDVIKPSLLGAIARHDGAAILRQNGYGPLRIPLAVDTISFYISYDEINNPEEFRLNEFVIGYEQDGFVPQDSFIMEILDTPILDYGLFGGTILYTHKIELSLKSLPLNEEHIFIRTRVQDESNLITEIPTDDAFYNIKEYMSFIRMD